MPDPTDDPLLALARAFVAAADEAGRFQIKHGYIEEGVQQAVEEARKALWYAIADEVREGL